MDKVTEEIMTWKKELESEKVKNTEEVNKEAEKVTIAKTSYSIAEQALDSMDRGEERTRYYEENVKPLEDALDLAEQQFESMKLAKGMRNAKIDLLLAEIEMKVK
ncbi:hypothetical protein [Desertibacillus haloalkaliphilus]|uniref:hypothetical protein n=1 Tax=Desertibacillus haloalkaliphilus TaxID=1328930 RepID=UPI001C25CBED|nr:hypothetical protein [Desertibacillus haloalkaliphilus]MBU8906162.1 hypothetical protein [Desertibacillus haloalkaliphilus]